MKRGDYDIRGLRKYLRDLFHGFSVDMMMMMDLVLNNVEKRVYRKDLGRR